jgi:HlyD family secretion protein
MNKLYIGFLGLIGFCACGNGEEKYDAMGTFEATEVVISAESSGKLLRFDVGEGDTLRTGQVVGQIDCRNIDLQKAQAEASLSALRQKTNDAAPQVAVLNEQLRAQQQLVAVQREQLRILEKEVARLQNLVRAEAATRKQLDDAEGQASVLRQQIAAAEAQLQVIQQQIRSQQEAVAIQNRAVLSENAPMSERVAQISDLLARCTVTNPFEGTVLVKYAEANEVVGAGKALYKLADLRVMTLRAYLTGDQLALVRLNQPVSVLVDDGSGGYRTYAGQVSFVSGKAEFTPKTIQTKEERANLVYAVKITVPNTDGLLKIGQYGEVLFTAR